LYVTNWIRPIHWPRMTEEEVDIQELTSELRGIAAKASAEPS
jgi:hypothetical protein